MLLVFDLIDEAMLILVEDFHYMNIQLLIDRVYNQHIDVLHIYQNEHQIKRLNFLLPVVRYYLIEIKINFSFNTK